jgi:hypothetical protein
LLEGAAMSAVTLVGFHPLAEIFPLMEGAEFDALSADIQANGLINPITMFEGKVLDGRNRLRACATAGVAPRYETYTGDDPAGFVVSQNVTRRHLNESQRALVAARLANLPEGRPTKTAHACAVSQDDAADRLQVSRRSVQSAKAVIDKADPAVFRAVEQGRLAVSRAVEIIDLPVEDQRSLAALPDNDIASAHDRIKRKLRVDAALQRIQAQAGATPAWPTGRWPIMYADCPWEDEFGLNARSIDNHYPTMTFEEIRALPVPEIVTPESLSENIMRDCIVFAA